MGLYKFCPVSSFITAAVIHYHRLGGFHKTTKNSLPTVLEPGRPRSGCAGRASPAEPASQCPATLPVSPGAEGVRDLLKPLFEDTITLEGSARVTRSPAKGPVSKHHHFGQIASYEF